MFKVVSVKQNPRYLLLFVYWRYEVVSENYFIRLVL